MLLFLIPLIALTMVSSMLTLVDILSSNIGSMSVRAVPKLFGLINPVLEFQRTENMS